MFYKGFWINLWTRGHSPSKDESPKVFAYLRVVPYQIRDEIPRAFSKRKLQSMSVDARKDLKFWQQHCDH
jgi:hypothetical protein